MNSSKQHKLRFIISGGGSGGHIFPAIAIAKRLEEEFENVEILFIGAKGRMEMEKVPEAGFPIKGLWISGLQRKLSTKNLSFPFKLISSLMKARRIIKSFKPDAVIGVGGFASGPTLFAASRMGIPTLIQEQNSFPGITNRLLAKRVNRICVAYDGLERFFPSQNIRMTGNPVRAEMIDTKGKRDAALEHFHLQSGKPVLLVVGGSLGARTINQAVEKHLATLISDGLQVIWQTGKTYIEQAKSAAEKIGPDVHVTTFIREMDLAYAAADIVVSRAGAIAVSELCLIGKPVILVPSPNVAEDHQTKNARALSEKAASILLPDNQALNELRSTISLLINDTERMKSLSENISKLSVADATGNIVKQIKELLGEQK